MELIDIESDFKSFQENLNSLPNFYKNSNGNLNIINEINKDDFFNLNSHEISDVLFLLEELNKAIQININENNIDECEELLSILRKPMGQTYQKSLHHKKSKKSVFKPFTKPRKIFVKVLKTNSPLKDIQYTTQNTNSKKTAASSTSIKSNNNFVNITEKVNDETNK